MSRKQWRCFHCDDVFTTEKGAREHFGASEMSSPGCQLKGHEHGLLGIIRDQEIELAHYRGEDGAILRSMFAMQGDHATALRRAEELGYSRGLASQLEPAALGVPPEDGKA